MMLTDSLLKDFSARGGFVEMRKLKTVTSLCREEHPLAFHAHQEGGFEVGDKNGLLAHEEGDVLHVPANAREDRSLFRAEIHRQFEHLSAFGDALDMKDFADAQIDFANIVDRDLLFECWRGFSGGFIGHGAEFVDLCLNHSVFDFGEEDLGLG